MGEKESFPIMNTTASRGPADPRYRQVTFSLLVLLALSLALSKSATNVLVALLCLVLVYALVRYPGYRRVMAARMRQPLLFPLAIYIGIALIGVSYSENISDGFGIVNKMAGMALVYFLTAIFADTLDDERQGSAGGENLLLAFIAGVAILDVIGFLTYVGVVGDRKFFLPLFPMHVHHIWFANINAVAFYAAVFLALLPGEKMSSRTKYLLLAFLPVSLLCILLSFSRTAWFGLAITFVVMSFFLVKNRRQYLLLLGAFAGAGLVAYWMNRIVHERILQIISDITLFFSGQARTNIGERFLMWQGAFKMFLSNPLFGVGTGDFVRTMHGYIRAGEFPDYLTQYNQPHSIYFFALATNGLLGLGALLFMFYRSLTFSYRVFAAAGRARLFGLLAFAAAVHYLVGGFTDSFFNIQMLRYTFGFIMGLCIRSFLSNSSSR